MLPRKTIEAYLFFLLRHRLAVSAVVALITVGLALFMYFRMHVFTNFFDLYPPNHPYVRLYQQYRSMFGTANTVLVVVEVKKGTIFDDPETIQKVDRITLAFLHDIPGVNGEQVLSITHPKVKTTLTSGSGIKVVPLHVPVGAKADLSATIDLLHGQILKGPKDPIGDLPENEKERVGKYQQQLVEAIVETNEDLMNRYLEGQELSYDELRSALHTAVREGQVIAVLCAIAIHAGQQDLAGAQLGPTRRPLHCIQRDRLAAEDVQLRPSSAYIHG